MSSKRHKKVNTLSGIGTVLDKDEEIARVRYELNVYQEFISNRTFSGSSETPGLHDIKGWVEVTDGERNLITGDQFTLQLEDGRTINFFATHGNPVSSRYEIAVSGGIQGGNDT